MKRKLPKHLIVITITTLFVLAAVVILPTNEGKFKLESYKRSITSKKSIGEKYTNAIEREKHEYDLQKNPSTGRIPYDEKGIEFELAQEARFQSLESRLSQNDYNSRGPSNLGGRARALKIDLSDNTSNTILAGGVSSGLFRTTDGGSSWTKVSANDEIHNVTALAQDPRPGFQNIWYYGTGEWSGNSASLGGGSFYHGQGIWRSTNNGVSWTQLPDTNSEFTVFDSRFDYIHNLQVHPITGDLFIAATGRIYRYDGTNFTIELTEPGNNVGWTDLTIASDGTVYASLDNSDPASQGVWTSPTGNGNWTRIAENFTPFFWMSGGSARTVLKTAPSNPDILYALYDNGNSGPGVIEAGLWRYDASSGSWTNYSLRLPDEPGGDLAGNDPFAIQGAYDLVIAVNPVDENFLLVGGTNAYKIDDITNTSLDFVRIGGYDSNLNYAIYQRSGDEHHPDLHAFEFDPFDTTGTILFTGSDGGIHKTTDIYASEVNWINLNNDFQTYQFYHIAMDPTSGSDAILGGAQDNGTVFGGSDFGLPNQTEMSRFSGGDGVAVGFATRDNNTEFQLFYGSQNGFARTFDSRTGFRDIRPFNSSSQFVTYFYLDPDNTNALYYAGLSSLYLTDDAENVTTSNWTNAGSLVTGENLRTFATTPGAYNPASSNLFIGGDDGGLFRVADPQNITNLVSAENITPPGGAQDGAIVSGIAIHPTNPDIMLVVYANYGIDNIFLTNNATAANPSWTLVEQNLFAHSIRSAAITEINGEVIYFVGTARGLYSSIDPTSTDWTLEGPDQIGLAVVSGLVYRHADGKLLVGTHGNGIYESSDEALSINDLTTNELDISFFPNPVNDKITLQGKNAINVSLIPFEIYSLTGSIVKKGTTNSSGELNTAELSAGLYFLRVEVDNKPMNLKFIKK